MGLIPEGKYGDEVYDVAMSGYRLLGASDELADAAQDLAKETSRFKSR